MPLGDALLILGASLRLTRFVTTDDLGAWWIREPAYRAALRHLERTGEPPWWDKYRAGLECPHCWSFWAALAVIGSYAAAGKTVPWRIVAGALASSYVAGHVSARLDAVPGPREPAS